MNDLSAFPPVRNATSAQLDRVQDTLSAANQAVLDAFPIGSESISAGDLIDRVARQSNLDRGPVQMALVSLMRVNCFKLDKHFAVTRTR
jgi:hypothetical protein